MGLSAKRLVTLLAALAVVLLGLEVGLRAFARLRPGHSAGNQFAASDPALGWRHVRGARGVFRGPDFAAPVRINRLGLRGEEIHEEKPGENTVRILMLGDSVTAGFEVGEERTFAARLGSALNRCAGNGFRYETINAGVRGYGTDQSLLYYEREGRRLGASLVVYTLVQNDVYENTRATGLGGHYPKPRFRLAGGGLLLEAPKPPGRTPAGAAIRLHRFLRLRSRLYGAILTGIRRVSGGAPAWIAEIHPEYVRTPGTDPAGRTALLRALLARLAEGVRAEGARMLVPIFPGPFERDREALTRTLALAVPEAALRARPPDPDAFHRTYLGVARSLGVSTVETLPAFRRAAAAGKRLYFADGHLNPAGHALLADLLLRRIVRDQLIPLAPGAAERCLQAFAGRGADGGAS